MTREKAILIKWTVIILIMGIGFIFKGLPMAVALAVGMFILIQAFKNRMHDENE